MAPKGKKSYKEATDGSSGRFAALADAGEESVTATVESAVATADSAPSTSSSHAERCGTLRVALPVGSSLPARVGPDLA
jgi:hypothetical protein